MENDDLGQQAKALIGFVTGYNFSHKGCVVLGGMIMPFDWQSEQSTDSNDEVR